MGALDCPSSFCAETNLGTIRTLRYTTLILMAVNKPNIMSHHVPHILLPCVQILALTLPPFPNRATIFVPLIVAAAFASATNLNEYDNELRAALISQWPWYLGTIQDLLSITPPEDRYWPVRQVQQAQKLAFGWPKFQWALSLWCNPRGINWSHQIRGLRRGFAPLTRKGFVYHQLKWLAMCYLAVDILGTYTDRHFYPTGVNTATLTVRADSWLRSLYNSMHILAQVNCQLQYQYYSVSLLTVALGISNPEDWPPWLGRIEDVTLVRKYWSGFCHQIIRRVFVGYSAAVVSFFGLQRGTGLAHYTQSYASFIMSGLFHGLTTYIMPYSSKHTFNDRFGLYFVFFIFQAMACQAEDIVLWLYDYFFVSNTPSVPMDSGLARTEKLSTSQNGHNASAEPKSRCKPKSETWMRVVGHVWVICWFWFSMGWAADSMLRSEVSHLTPLPASVVGPALDWASNKVWFKENLQPLVEAYLHPVNIS